MKQILDVTAMADTQIPDSDKIKIEYRSRLSCFIEDETRSPTTWSRTFVDSQGEQEVQPAVC